MVLYVDGASRGNPGPAAYGVFSKGGEIRLSQAIGRGTNNEAEWQGFLAALRLAKAKGVEFLEIRADSQLVVRQFNGQYKVRAEHLKAYLDEARTLALAFKGLTVTHVPREMNSDADALANLALDTHGQKS